MTEEGALATPVPGPPFIEILRTEPKTRGCRDTARGLVCPGGEREAQGRRDRRERIRRRRDDPPPADAPRRGAGAGGEHRLRRRAAERGPSFAGAHHPA